MWPTKPDINFPSGLLQKMFAKPGIDKSPYAAYNPSVTFRVSRKSNIPNRAYKAFLVDSWHTDYSSSWSPCHSHLTLLLIHQSTPAFSLFLLSAKLFLTPGGLHMLFLSTGRPCPSPAPMLPTLCPTNSSFNDSLLGTILPPHPWLC